MNKKEIQDIIDELGELKSFINQKENEIENKIDFWQTKLLNKLHRIKKGYVRFRTSNGYVQFKSRKGKGYKVNAYDL